MKYQTRVQLSFALVILVFIAVFAVQLVFFGRFSSQVELLLGRKLQALNAVQTAREAVLRIRADIWDIILFNPGDRQSAISRLDKQASTFYAARRNLSGILAKESSLDVNNLDLAFRAFYFFAKDTLAMPNLRSFTSSPWFPDKFQENQSRLEIRLDQTSQNLDKEFRQSLELLHVELRTTTMLTVIAPLVALIVAFAVSLLLSRRLAASLKALGGLALRAGNGDYAVRSELEASGSADSEIALLAGSFNHLMDETENYRNHMLEMVAERTRALEANNKDLQSTMESLRHTQGQLIQSEKMAAIGVLVAGVAHEVNTPLGNSIMASSYLEDRISMLHKLMDRNELKRSDLESFIREGEESVRIMCMNLRRAGDLVSSFKRVAVDQESNQRRTFDLKMYVDEIILSHNPLFRSGTCSITNHIPQGVELDSRPGALYQILANLIVNSIKHGFDGREHGAINIAARLEAEKVLIDYRDDGWGIDPAHRARIFDPFFTTRRNQGGSGLGMYISMNLARTLGGTIDLVDDAGQGTWFRLEILRNLG